MKRFFQQVLIVVVGIFASLVFLTGVLLLFARPSQPRLADATVLRIALHGRVVEQGPAALMSFLNEDQGEVIDLLALKGAIKHAEEDKKIEGIYLEAGALTAGWASLEEIREALLSFKSTGKFIVAYGESYTQKTYYLASLADEIVLHPVGIFPLRGLSKTVFFYKALLDKLEVAPQIFRVGRYKSAVEPFVRQDMSQASRHQSMLLLKAIDDHFFHKVAAARKLKQASLKRMADTLAVVLPQDACRAKLVSQVGHFDAVEAWIKTKLAVDKEAVVNYVSYEAYASLKQPVSSAARRVAVLIAEGVIVDGEGKVGTIGSKALASQIRALRDDDTVKAIVLRINSPGGSALASDVLWKELVLTKAKKPVVASMSDVAASGGYYLAVACDHILAHPTTVTGSIGIFGLFFDVHALLRNRLGITTDVVKTGSSADLLNNPGRSFTTHEKAVVQRVVDKGYDTFLARVAQGRKLDKEAVARVASGRVWSGQAAQKKGLVDELGGLEDAIRVAAERAALEEDYVVSYWPKPQTLFEQIVKGLLGKTERGAALRALQASFPGLKPMQELGYMTGVQARLPYCIEID